MQSFVVGVDAMMANWRSDESTLDRFSSTATQLPRDRSDFVSYKFMR
jgi:hypothetical protein